MTSYQGVSKWDNNKYVGSMLQGAIDLGSWSYDGPEGWAGNADKLTNTLLGMTAISKPQFIIDFTNDEMIFSVDGVTVETVAVAWGAYTGAELALELQNKMDPIAVTYGFRIFTLHTHEPGEYEWGLPIPAPVTVDTPGFWLGCNTNTFRLLFDSAGLGSAKSEKLGLHMGYAAADTAGDFIHKTTDSGFLQEGPWIHIKTDGTPMTPTALAFYRPRTLPRLLTAGEQPSVEPRALRVRVYSDTVNLGKDPGSWEASSFLMVDATIEKPTSPRDEMHVIYIPGVQAGTDWFVHFSDASPTDPPQDRGYPYFSLGYFGLFVLDTQGTETTNVSPRQRMEYKQRVGSVEGSAGTEYRSVGPVLRADTYTFQALTRVQAEQLVDWLEQADGKPALYLLDESRLPETPGVCDAAAAIFGTMQPRGSLTLDIERHSADSINVSVTVQQRGA